MSTIRWTGEVDGDWDNVLNWSGGVVPANLDTVIFSGGDVSVTAGLSQTSLSLAGLFIASDYLGNIGTSLVPLGLSSSTLVTISGHNGSIYLDGILPTIRKVGGNGSVYLGGSLVVIELVSCGGILTSHDGTTLNVLTSIESTSCSGVEVTNIRGTSVIIDGLVMTHSDGVSGTVRMLSGTLVVTGSAGITSLLQYGGLVSQNSSAAIGETVLYSGTLSYSGNTTTGLNVTNTTMLGGLLDLSAPAASATIAYFAGTITPPIGGQLVLT